MLRKIAYISFLGLLAVIGVLWTIGVYHTPGTEQVAKSNARFTTLPSNVKEIDVDQDGLRDWEEALWGTSDTQADSDGDGTPDGEEVQLKRNPAKAGPGDTIEVPVETEVAVSGNTSPKTITESWSRTLLMDTVNPSETILPPVLEESKQKAFVADTIAATKFEEYTAKDFTVVPNTDANSKNYSKRVGDILNQYAYIRGQREPEIIKEALLSRKEEDFNKVTQTSLGYFDVTEALRLVPVQEKNLALHLLLVNEHYRMGQALVIIGNMNQDPVKGMIALGELHKANTNLQTFYTRLTEIHS